MPAELVTEDIKVGTGEEAKVGQIVSVHYVGTLTNGQKFDSSRDRGRPFEFPLGLRKLVMLEGGLNWKMVLAGMSLKSSALSAGTHCGPSTN